MAYQFPEDLQEFLADELRHGGYDSEDEFFADLLRMLKKEREAANAGIAAGLRDLEEGRTQPLKEAFRDIRQELGIDSE